MKSKRFEIITSRAVITFFGQLLLLFGGIGLTEAADCGRCSCTTDVVTGDQNVICLGIPFAEIKTTFTANTGFLDINRFDVVPQVGDSIIPADLLGSHRARIIHLASCGVNPMEIDAEAFKSSSRTTKEFTSIKCDVGKITWSFLNGFSSLNLLQLEGASKIQSLGSLPLLPSLTRLSLTTCQGFGPLTFPGTSLIGLQTLVMTENGAELTDGKVESILRTLTAAKSFQVLSLKDNPSINRIPDALAMLSALHSLDLSLCDIATVASGSLFFSAPAVKTLNLENSKLSTISDNSFDNGYYGNAKVLLDGNRLIDFRSSVYRKILIEMQKATGAIGSLSITNNSIKCDDCQLAWLIRDFRELLPFVTGTCSNGTDFNDLNPNWYNDQLCDVLITTSTEPTTMTSEPTSIMNTELSNPTETQSSSEADTTSTGNPDKTTDPGGTTTPVVGTQTTPDSQTTVSESGSSSTSTSTPPDSDNYDTFFYILFGILGGIALILIIGFIYFGCILARRRRARSSSVDVSSRHSSIVPELHRIPAFSNDNPRHPEPPVVDHRLLYARMAESIPPPTATNNFGQYPAGRQYNTATATIITPYRQPQSASQPPPVAPSGRVRGLKRVDF